MKYCYVFSYLEVKESFCLIVNLKLPPETQSDGDPRELLTIHHSQLTNNK